MRVTQSMMQKDMLNNLFKSQASMNKYLTQIQTGKKISRPSDDPVIAMKGMTFRTDKTEIEQYQRNTTEIWSWMDNSDDALDKGTKVMQRLEYLAVQASNGTYTEDERKAVKEEVDQLKEQLMDIANTQVNGKYIFNGTDTDKPPIQDGKIVKGDGRDNMVKIAISKGIQFEVNVNPDVFSEEVFKAIDDFSEALDTDDQEAIEKSIGELQDATKGIINGRAKLGARMNRLELVEDRLEQQYITAEDTIAKNEGVDFEEAVTNLLSQEVMHRAALSAGAKIIQPSLMDFLR